MKVIWAIKSVIAPFDLQGNFMNVLMLEFLLISFFTSFIAYCAKL